VILDNLTRAIRDQNWFAVGIELVIVILGVVIGFQVNAWNEDRQAEQRLERHLAAVYEELGENALRLNAFVTKVEDDLANMRDFMAWIADPDAPPERLHRYLFHLLPVANLELEQGN